MITATPEAIDAIQAFLSKKEIHKPIRIHLRSTGCCDASLGLAADERREDDWTEDVEGILFVIGKDLEKMTGDITIAASADGQETGFVVTSENPISEWDGFGVCRIEG
ncbi:MAG: hypothetical protein EG826_05470 [Deltaproteobacteria bacterium]|nr:hypothetical protein [Deltaproteobacteria bacterium]